MDVTEKPQEPIMQLLLRRLSDAGLSYLLMGIVIFFLWQDKNQSDIEIRKEVKQIQKEYRICTDSNRDLIFKQLSISNQIIEKNTQALEKIVSMRR